MDRTLTSMSLEPDVFGLFFFFDGSRITWDHLIEIKGVPGTRPTTS